MTDHFVFDGGLGKGEKKPTMNLKRWFLWLCSLALLASEVMLFQANQQKNAALVESREAQHDADRRARIWTSSRLPPPRRKARRATGCARKTRI